MASPNLDAIPLNLAVSSGIGVLTLLIILHFMSKRKLHPSEPTVIPPWIPFIGHLLGMAIHGGRYIKRLGLSYHREPILTLPVPGSRIYVVTEPSLAASVQRNTKTLSFSPMLPEITKRVLGLDDQTIAIVSQNLDPEPGEPRGFLADIHDLVYSSLGPGDYLNNLSCDAAQELCLQLSEAITSPNQLNKSSEPVDLLQWIRHFVTVGTAKYLFGPNNPIAEEPALEDAFWAFDHGLGGLFIGILPSLTASKAYRAREKLVVAFKKYLEAGHLTSASNIVQGRARIEKEYGMSIDMTARSALSFLFAGIVNTTTTTFWVVLRLFADKGLLSRVRVEVQKALQISAELTNTDSLSIAAIKDHCQTLVSVYRESLRIGSENFSVRIVKEDIVLADWYFLTKGAVVQISGGAMHSRSSIWGEDVDEFNPDRFLSPKVKGSNFHPAAFRSFGGGKTLCPGRDFAKNEILMFAAMIVHGFNLSAAEGGTIRVPKKNDRVMPVHILEPTAGDCPRVTIRAREESEILTRLKVVL